MKSQATSIEVSEICGKRAYCGINDPTGFLCQAYYECHPKPEFLKEYRCLECGKQVKVPNVTPYCGKEPPTGHFLSYMDENFSEHALGVLCQGCAQSLFEKDVIGFGSAGKYFTNEWMIVEATLEKKDWQPKRPEFLFEEEDDEEYDDDW